MNISEDLLVNYAAQLGSDCPFFIVNKPCLAGGRGEFLQEISLDLSHCSFLLVDPGIHISTAMAFSLLQPAIPTSRISEIIKQPLDTWKTDLKNDFENPLFERYPVLRRIREQLYNAGAVYASMSGSGSCLYGIFEKGRLPVLSLGGDYKTFYID